MPPSPHRGTTACCRPLSDVRGKVARHRAQLLAPRPPVVTTTGSQIEVAVVAADSAVTGIEIPAGALPDICEAAKAHCSIIGGAARRRAEHPQPGVLISHKHGVCIRRMPLPPAELGSPPHVRTVGATVILQNLPDGTVDPGPFGSEHSR